MKLISYHRDGKACFGAVVDDAVIELSGRVAAPDLASLVADAQQLQQAQDIVAKGQPDRKLASVDLDPVIPNPRKVVCVGINYVKHAEEAGRKVGDYPVIFQRYSETVLAHGKPLLRPKASTHFDFEAELAVVIGKGGSHIDPANAMEHVAGYTCFNDASVRDWQFHTHQYGMGKNFRATGAVGPWLVTADEIPEYRNLTIQGVLNGQVMQEGKLSELAFDVPALIAYISQALPWHPGDILATGTPSGIGFKRTPPVFLKDGDTFDVVVPGVGTLSNPVVDET
jgi:2-keto-4-pentenoate hydratase/2-oxohepta-3-ene-1,7-dioic acid hydratase in catechol pathway